MSDRIKQVPDGDDVRELLQVLTRIFEMVCRLPPGAERTAALEQIRDFQTRLGAILLERVRGRSARVTDSTARQAGFDLPQSVASRSGLTAMSNPGTRSTMRRSPTRGTPLTRSVTR